MHASFVDPSAPDNAPPRESLEARFIYITQKWNDTLETWLFGPEGSGGGGMSKLFPLWFGARKGLERGRIIARKRVVCYKH